MKKLLLFITVLFFGVYSIQAQDETSYGFAQGDWVLGGGITFANADDGDTEETSASTIAPSAHYFINDSWAIGASVGLMSMEANMYYHTITGIIVFVNLTHIREIIIFIIVKSV